MLLLRSQLRTVLACALLLAALSGASGCSLLYRHSREGTAYSLYSDHDPAFLAKVAADIERIQEGFGQLFSLPPGKPGHATILLEGESGGEDSVVDLGYSPRLLGYYLPFFKLISIDAVAPWTREQAMLRQILLHELAHHYVLSFRPETGEECWLNEGLAGNLESAVFDARDFAYPLINPSLLKLARGELLADPQRHTLPALLSLGWGGFHQDGRKEAHYALAWSAVWFLLERHLPAYLPLAQRIRMLLELDRDEIRGLDASWRECITSLDLTGELLRLARLDAGSPRRLATLTGSDRLAALWAIEQLGLQRNLERPRAAAALLVGIEGCHETELLRCCCLAFLRLAARPESRDRGDAAFDRCLEAGRRRLQDLVSAASTDAGLRHEILEEAARHLSSQPRWVPVFVGLLDSPEGEIRVAAARGLGRTETKPTILNPSFWRAAPALARESEVEEWRQWLSGHRTPFVSDEAAARSP